jgi:hypothetical protein
MIPDRNSAKRMIRIIIIIVIIVIIQRTCEVGIS